MMLKRTGESIPDLKWKAVGLSLIYHTYIIYHIVYIIVMISHCVLYKLAVTFCRCPLSGLEIYLLFLVYWIFES